FFSSGAEPPRHVEALAAGAAALARSGAHAAVVFAVRGGRLDRVLAGVAGVEVVTFPGRAELDRVTAHHFPRFDVVVSPPHERSNWAAALGLPFLLVGPDIGPFAPRNRRWLLDHGVAAEIIDADHARRLPGQLDELRGSGRLLAMSERGERPCPGFDEAARFAIREVERRSG
ncbi:MAG TPA: hypothetical protein VKU85_07515, partial [bacterium]|nr:hypothetical protein [bacterium]